MSEPTDVTPREVTDERARLAPTRFPVTLACERAYGLAEGPLWDEPRERVMWVDVNAGKVHSGSIDGAVISPGEPLRFDETVGAVVCSDDGQLLVAGQRDVYRVGHGSDREVVAALVPAGQDSRLNDGACDPAGRFLVGSLALDAREREERLWQLGEGGTVATVDDDLTVSNGLAWSPNGAVLYSVDTTRGVVWSRPYNPASGGWGARAELIRIDDGSPDGLCVDTAGNLWVAVWGAGQVRSFTPGGDALVAVDVPAPHTSSVAFVGRARDTLLITTARDELSKAELEQFPLSGCLFTARVNAAGVPTTPWSGV